MEKLLKQFGDLESLQEWLAEQINDGSEISRGKTPDDKSKEQKANEAELGDEGEEEVPEDSGGGEAEGGAFEPGPGPAGAPDGAGAVDPVSAPGSQIAVGKKVVAAKDDPKAVKVEAGKETNKLDMRPFIKVIDDLSNGT